MYSSIFKFIVFCSLLGSSLQATPFIAAVKLNFSRDDSSSKSKELLDFAKKYYESGDYQAASERLYYLMQRFIKSEFLQEASFYLGMSEYHLGEYDAANDYLSRYLKGESNPEYFRQAIETKFAIAEKFRLGAKKRFYDSKLFPKWSGGELLAIEIYDEITATIPCDELAIRSFYAKACLLFQINMYNDAVSTLQTLIRRFPKNELAIASYVLIEEIFLNQSKIETQNTDILELARINLRHFQQDFPKEEQLGYATGLVNQIEETFATSLFDIGQLYERKGEFQAATIYYFQAVRQFPSTNLAAESHKRIVAIAPKDVIEKSYACMNPDSIRE